MKHKYNAMMADIFKETFCWLPLGHVLNKRVLVVHGGLFSRDSVKLDDIRAINRYRYHSATCPRPLQQHVCECLDWQIMRLQLAACSGSVRGWSLSA